MNTSAINAAMREKFCAPEWALAFEVGNSVGFSTKRHADAVAMNLWPSRGLEIHGFEFKASRGDWLRELKNPEKAEAVAQYCDRWWVVTLPDIVKNGELPIGWGLIELKGQKLKIVRQAPDKEAKDINRKFMAALFRRMTEIDQAVIDQIVQKKIDEERAQMKRQIDVAVESRTRRHEELKRHLEAIEKHSGLRLEDFQYRTTEFGDAVQFVMDCGIAGTYSSVKSIQSALLRATENIEKAFENIEKMQQIDSGAVAVCHNTSACTQSQNSVFKNLN